MKPILLLALLLLPACATTRQSIEVQVIHTERPEVTVSYRCDLG